MVDMTKTDIKSEIHYPESDGKPMADNTKQFNWIAKIKGGLEWQFADDPDVFIAGDHLWYPVEGYPNIRVAPDVMVVFGRPKGDRGSYRQWEEGNIPPQVVFEVLSPGNTIREMTRKLSFYGRYGVEEYYVYDPDNNEIDGYIRQSGQLELINPDEFIVDDGWTSPLLGIKMRLTVDTLIISHRNGREFLQYEEMGQELETMEARAFAAEQKAAELAAKLRELGIDPDSI